jgi:hypothetical protein
MDGKSLTSILKELTDNPKEPYTIIRYVRLSQHIVDSRFEYVSPAAGDIYEQEPEQLVGRYLSEFHTLTDYYRGCVFSIARKLKRKNIPDDYIGRILTAEGHIQPVYKKITQLIGASGDTYWITRLERVRETDPPPEPDVDKLSITPEAFQAWAGLGPVAYVEKLLRENPTFFATQSTLDQMPNLQWLQAFPLLSRNSNVAIISKAKGASSLVINSALSDRTAETLEELHRLSNNNVHLIWVRDGEEPRQVAIQEVIEQLQQAMSQGQRFCVRCLKTSRVYAVDPDRCSVCRQPWYKPYERRPWKRRR